MKKYLACFLALIMAISLIPQGIFTLTVHADSFPYFYGGFNFSCQSTSGNTLTLTNFTKQDDESTLIIPSTIIDSYTPNWNWTVTAIGNAALANCSNISAVILPDTIQSIGSNAFDNCSALKSVGYTGSETDRNSLIIESGNEDLLNATWYYNYCGEDAHTYTDDSDDTCNNCQWVRTIITGIELVKLPKTEYITGEIFDLSGATLRVYFNDNTYDDIAIPHYFTYPNHSRYFSKKLNAYDMVTVSGGLTRDAAVSGICFANAGEQTLTLTYFGQNTTLPVTVTEKIIKDISINDGSKNLDITVTYTDNTIQEMTAQSFISGAGDATPDVSNRFGELRTDKGIYYATFSTYTDGSMSLSMNGVTSNILENGCDWYSLLDRYNLVYNESYSNMASHMDSFDGKITADNIDSIIEYVLITDHEWPEYTEDSDDYEIDGKGNGGKWFKGQALRNAILKHFAVDQVDLSLSAHYDSPKDRYPAIGSGSVGFEVLPASLTYKNGYWEACWPLMDYSYSYARFDDQGRIMAFSQGKPIVDPAIQVGNASYDSFEEALSAAVAGQTITLNADVVATGACTMLGADVTLDLNGHNLTVSNFITFGDVVDTTEGEGKLVISDDPTKAFTNLQATNSQMPLYDEDGYRFFSYSVINKGSRTADGGQAIKFGTHVQLANRKAYELLAKEKNGNTAITFHITYQGVTLDYTFKAETLAAFGQAVCDKYDKNVADKTGTVMVLTITGFDSTDGDPIIGMVADYHSTRTLVHKKQSIH